MYDIYAKTQAMATEQRLHHPSISRRHPVCVARRLAAVVLLTYILAGVSSCGSRHSAGRTGGVVILFYDPSVGKDTVLEEVKDYGSAVIYDYRNFNGLAVTVPPRRSMDETIEHYEKTKGVISVMRDNANELHLDASDSD